MSSVSNDYDPIGIVVDWIDACKSRRLDALLDLYDVSAAVECKCREGGSFQGRSAIEAYWRERLARSGEDTFEIDALVPDPDGIVLDYHGFDGVPVRTYFRFTASGKIRLTACEPVKGRL